MTLFPNCGLVSCTGHPAVCVDSKFSKDTKNILVVMKNTKIKELMWTMVSIYEDREITTFLVKQQIFGTTIQFLKKCTVPP